MLSEDIPYLVQFRRKHIPGLDIEASRLNDAAIEMIARYIAAKGWKGISLMARLISELPGSPGHRKRRQSTQIDRPSKRSAHGPSEDLGMMQLLEAVRPEECQNTFADLFTPQVEGPEITTFMKTTGENSYFNTWVQDLVPWSIKQPDITTYMTTFIEGGQSDSWVQDLVPWPVNEPEITAYMGTFSEDSQTNPQLQGLFLQPLQVPDLTTPGKPFEHDSCLPLQICADSSTNADI